MSLFPARRRLPSPPILPSLFILPACPFRTLPHHASMLPAHPTATLQKLYKHMGLEEKQEG